MKKYPILSLAAALILAACGGDDEPGGPDDSGRSDGKTAVNISAGIVSFTDGDYDDTFADGDEIAVYAVERGRQLASSGNYADAVRYTFRDGRFEGNIATDGHTQLTYYAVCPYSAGQQGSTFRFFVQADQRYASNMLSSDVCTGASQATSSNAVSIQLRHRLCAACVRFEGDNLAGRSLSVTLEDVALESDISIEGEKTSTGQGKGNIRMFNNDGVFRAILPPQSFPVSQTFAVVTMDGVKYPVSFEDTQYFEEGCMTTMTLTYNGEDDEFVVITGQIAPWQ